LDTFIFFKDKFKLTKKQNPFSKTQYSQEKMTTTTTMTSQAVQLNNQAAAFLSRGDLDKASLHLQQALGTLRQAVQVDEETCHQQQQQQLDHQEQCCCLMGDRCHSHSGSPMDIASFNGDAKKFLSEMQTAEPLVASSFEFYDKVFLIAPHSSHQHEHDDEDDHMHTDDHDHSHEEEEENKGCGCCQREQTQNELLAVISKFPFRPQLCLDHFFCLYQALTFFLSSFLSSFSLQLGKCLSSTRHATRTIVAI